jgi:hypothetical protein
MEQQLYLQVEVLRQDLEVQEMWGVVDLVARHS